MLAVIMQPSYTARRKIKLVDRRTTVRPSGIIMARVVGIDLGTTNSAVAVVEGGEPRVLLNREGERLTPSYVATRSGTRRFAVGRAALRQAVANPGGTVFGVKRLLGRRYSDPAVRASRRQLPYDIQAAKNGDVRVVLGGQAATPSEVAALLLRKLKLDAEARLGDEVAQAVVTVPAYFDDAQRQATKDAGRIAGLDVVRIVNEPTAAALAYGLGQRREQVVAVLDLGGGTFDVSILHLDRGLCEVLATDGDSYLGGDDIDLRIVEWAVQEFQRDTGVNLSDDAQALMRLKEAAEAAKIELSTVREAEISLPYIARVGSGSLHLRLKLTRQKLEELSADLIGRTRAPTLRAISDAGLRLDQIDEVILVGGQTRMPAVLDQVRGIFGREVRRRQNPDEVVALGAAIQAGILAGEIEGMLLLDVTPLSLGVETTGGVMTVLIPRNTTIPVRRQETFVAYGGGQQSLEIHILQGEQPMAADNRSICYLTFEGTLPSGGRESARVRVIFDVDVNGILQVSALDEDTGRGRSLVSRSTSGLTSEEIELLARLVLESFVQNEGDCANDAEGQV